MIASVSTSVRNLQLLDVGFRIESDAQEPLRFLDQVYSAAEFRNPREGAKLTARFHINGGGPEERWVEFDDRREPLGGEAGGAVDVESWTFGRLLDGSRQFLLVHAAALAWQGRGLLVAGPTFAGKTTLAVRLAESGLHYYSDELAPIHRQHGLLYPFRRAAAVRLPGGGREFRRLDLLHASSADQGPLPCRLGWVFILDACLQESEVSDGRQDWTVILKPGNGEAERILTESVDLHVLSRSTWGGGLRLDLAPLRGGSLGAFLRSFTAEWSPAILYLGPVPRNQPGAFAPKPDLRPMSREEGALEILRHTLNRRSAAQLYAQYGEHPHLKAYAEIFAALVPARCFRLTPGTPEATVGLIRNLVEKDKQLSA